MIGRRGFMAGAAALLARPAAAETAHAFVFESIDGGELALADFAGRPVLVVNTASRCGFTYQYDALQALWERYRDRGLTVVGAPSDDFRQELDSEAEIKRFCEVNFALDFPMTSIVHVRGAEAHPFYAWAAQRAGPPRWNFHKYLIAGDGTIVAAFPSGVEPLDPELTSAVEALLPSS